MPPFVRSALVPHPDPWAPTIDYWEYDDIFHELYVRVNFNRVMDQGLPDVEFLLRGDGTPGIVSAQSWWDETTIAATAPLASRPFETVGAEYVAGATVFKDAVGNVCPAFDLSVVV